MLNQIAALFPEEDNLSPQEAVVKAMAQSASLIKLDRFIRFKSEDLSLPVGTWAAHYSDGKDMIALGTMLPNETCCIAAFIVDGDSPIAIPAVMRSTQDDCDLWPLRSALLNVMSMTDIATHLNCALFALHAVTMDVHETPTGMQ